MSCLTTIYHLLCCGCCVDNKIMNINKIIKYMYNDMEYLDKITYENTTPFIPPITAGKVVKVYDGDTFTLAAKLPNTDGPVYRFTVRLNGIDTPESRTKDKDEKTRGELSKNKLKELIENKIVKISTTIDPDDKFGRILAIIETKEGINVNEWLVTNNYAVAYKGQNKELVQEAHQKNTEILRARGELK